MEDIKVNTNGKFVTLTFSNEAYTELSGEFSIKGYELDNAVCKLAMRRFLERWRKKYGKSVRHWFATELGHQGTENVHLHGILWTDNINELASIWQYGFVWKGKMKNYVLQNYVNEKTVSYITKYMLKTDEQHKYYRPIVLCSPGIGKNYLDSYNNGLNKYKGSETKETYTADNGKEINLPIYWRNGTYTDAEREELWLIKLDKNERWIGGDKVAANDMEAVGKTLEYWQRKNEEMGYGSPKNWKAKEYERERRIIMQEMRKKKT